MKNKSVFDKILTKETYTKQEVKELLYGTYEGFTEGWIKAHPKSIQEAKKEVFDDIDKEIKIEDWAYNGNPSPYERIKNVKQRHLSTFAEKKLHNNNSKKNCFNTECYDYPKSSKCKDKICLSRKRNPL